MTVQRPIDPKRGFSIPKVKFEGTSKPLVSKAGLQALLSILDSTSLGEELGKCLPKEGSNRDFGSYQMAMLLIASLMSGHDCIDDIEEFDDDDLLETLFKDKRPTAKTLGNFLRRFEPEHIEALKLFLTKMGYSLREHSLAVHPHKGEKIPHFKIDGTSHEQHGSKIEGTGWMVTSKDKQVFGLASQTVFDELGFCYAAELLPAKHPKGGASKLLDQVLSPLRGIKVENPFVKVAHVLGDSAYLTESVIRAVTSHHALFSIAAPRTIQWNSELGQLDWVEWQFDEVLDKRKNRRSNPERHLARWYWSPSWADKKLLFPVVIKKEWRADEVFGEDCGSYHYHAVATNADLSKSSYQSVIESYRPRADVENMIKEFKLGFDAKHLPCLKFSANEVYFLFVLIAQNLIRWAALIEKPDKPHFSKKLRRKLINAPGMILTGSRQLTLKVKEKFKKEVTRFLEAWGSVPVKIPPLAFAASTA